MPGICDLHLHSHCSDGTFSPTEVVGFARDAGLDAMALTDHDTFDGVQEAQEAGRRAGIRVIAGVELSLDHEGTFHMIALGVDPDCERMRRVVDTLRDGRGERNRQMAARLTELGLPVTVEEAAERAGGNVVARPHFARALVEKGLVKDYQEAFDGYLGKGAKAYVDRPRVTLDEAIAAIAEAGGVSVLCHPFTLGYQEQRSQEGEQRLLSFLRELVDAGLDAIEARYGSYTAAQERFWERTAARVGLLRSGGSDFHGTNRAGNRVGVGRGRLRVPTSWLDGMLERAASRTH